MMKMVPSEARRVRELALGLTIVLLLVAWLALVVWRIQGGQNQWLDEVKYALVAVGAAVVMVAYLLRVVLRSAGVGDRPWRALLTVVAIALGCAVAWLGHDRYYKHQFEASIYLGYTLIFVALLVIVLLLALDPWPAASWALTRRLGQAGALLSLGAALGPLAPYFDYNLACGPCPTAVDPQHALFAVVVALIVVAILLGSEGETQPAWAYAIRLAPIALAVVLIAVFIPFIVGYLGWFGHEAHHEDPDLQLSLWAMGLAIVVLVVDGVSSLLADARQLAVPAQVPTSITTRRDDGKG